LIIRQFHDSKSQAFSYLIGDDATYQAALVDPVADHAADYYELIDELGLHLTYVLETHVHSTHQTAAGIMREITNAQTVLPEKASGYYADLFVKHGDTLPLGERVIRVHETPGHTMSCVTYQIGERHLFTGDTLWVGNVGPTELHLGGCTMKHYNSIQSLFKFPDHFRVYPGHGTRGDKHSTVGREKVENMVADKDLSSFIYYMDDRDQIQEEAESDTLSGLALA